MKTQIQKIHTKIGVQEYVMRVSTKICLKKRKKHPHQQEKKKKIHSIRTMHRICFEFLCL
jgi:hypothetical protein